MSKLSIKALVIRADACFEIADGSKGIEFRSWATNYRGPLGIIAAKRKDSGESAGKLICLVGLLDCVEAGPRDFQWMLGPNIIRIDPAIPVKGRLGLIPLELELNIEPARIAALMEPAATRKPSDSKPRTRRLLPAQEFTGNGLCMYDY